MNQWRSKNNLSISTKKYKKNPINLSLSIKAIEGISLLAKHYNRLNGNRTLSDFLEAIGTGEFILTPFILDSNDPLLIECYESGKQDALEKRPYDFELIFGNNQELEYKTAYRIGYLEHTE